MNASYLVDKSAYARFRIPAVAEVLRRLLEEGLVVTCAIVDLEILYSARNAAEYEAIRDELAGLEEVLLTPEVMDAARATQQALAGSGRHRIPIPDLIVAAAAVAVGVTVLHYDPDFETISAATGQPHQWVVPRGSI